MSNVKTQTRNPPKRGKTVSGRPAPSKGDTNIEKVVNDLERKALGSRRFGKVFRFR